MEIDDDDAWLTRDPLPSQPVAVVHAWLGAAFAAGAQHNPHAVALATLDADGRPSVRMVLCKRLEPEAGSAVFYTDRESRKGRALTGDPRAALAFYFGAQERQVRMEGVAEPTDDADSDAYFEGRPRDSQLAAHASLQSRRVASRAQLESALAAEQERFAAGPVPRPERWGGYRLRADRVELWRGRPARLHDRALWTRGADGSWRVERLQP